MRCMLAPPPLNAMVRQAGVSDAAAIAHLGGATFARAYGAIVRPEDMAGYVAGIFAPARIAAEIERADGYYMVVEIEAEIIGYARLAATVPPAVIPTACRMELVRIYLDQRYCGRGIGEKLLAAVFSKVREVGESALWLRVWQKNEGAIRFYRRHGFEIVGSEPYLIGETANPVVLMCAEFAGRG